MKFKKYQHIERFGTDEVEGIEVGKCYVFPKIDGTCSCVFLNDNGEISFGSRRRELSLEQDNAGFMAQMKEDARLRDYLKAHPTHRLYGEFLVPHSLKTYRDDVWRKFYVFDVVDSEKEGEGDSVYAGYLPYDEYSVLLDEYGIDYIPPLKEITNGRLEDFLQVAETNTYLIKDGEGAGEGVVIKNYNFVNKYGRTTWAKIVRNEFKEKHRKAMGTPKVDVETLENQIAEKYITEEFVKKEFEKLKESKGGWSSKYIQEFLNRTWHEFIDEEIWHAIKDFKNPTIDFKRLYGMVIVQIKNNLPEIF